MNFVKPTTTNKRRSNCFDPLKADINSSNSCLLAGLNTAFGYSAYAVLIYLGIHYSLAALLATILGVLFNFKTTGWLVFRNRNNRLLVKFIGTYVIIYAINTAFLGVFNFFKADMYVAGAVMLLPMAAVAFVLNKKFVFKG